MAATSRKSVLDLEIAAAAKQVRAHGSPEAVPPSNNHAAAPSKVDDVGVPSSLDNAGLTKCSAGSAITETLSTPSP